MFIVKTIMKANATLNDKSKVRIEDLIKIEGVDNEVDDNNEREEDDARAVTERALADAPSHLREFVMQPSQQEALQEHKMTRRRNAKRFAPGRMI